MFPKREKERERERRKLDEPCHAIPRFTFSFERRKGGRKERRKGRGGMAAGYLPRTKIFHEVGKGTVMAGTRRVIDRA